MWGCGGWMWVRGWVWYHRRDGLPAAVGRALHGWRSGTHVPRAVDEGGAEDDALAVGKPGCVHQERAIMSSVTQQSIIASISHT